MLINRKSNPRYNRNTYRNSKNGIKINLIKFVLILILAILVFRIGSKMGNMAYANSNSINSNDLNNSIRIKTTKQSVNKPNKSINKGKILIYSTHSCEVNKDSSVITIAEDLAKKLRKKGYDVTHDKTKFADIKGYNKAYYSSGEMLEKLDLSQYFLILDIHFNAGKSPAITKDINGNDVAKIEMIQTKENPYLQEENNIANGITENINKFGDISDGVESYYKQGIIYYNLSKSPNMLLVEIGNNMNNGLSCMRTNTYMASAIDTYLSGLDD